MSHFGVSQLHGVDGFEDYEPVTRETPTGLIAFFAVYVGLSIILTAPIICWIGRRLQPNFPTEQQDEDALRRGGEQELVEIPPQQQSTAYSEAQAAASSGDQESKSESGLNIQEESPINPQTNQDASSPVDPSRLPSSGRRASTGGERLSATPSVASTSRLRNDNNVTEPGPLDISRRPIRTWDLAASRRPWGHSRPLGRADLVRRSLEAERQSQASEEGSHGSRRSRTSRVSAARAGQISRPRPVSDAASSVLSEEIIEGEAEFYRQRYVRRSRNRQRRAPSESDNSLMPPLSPDNLSPEDAADAHDVGRVNHLEDYQQEETPAYLRWGPIPSILSCFGKVLDVAEQDYETQRILSLAIPSTIGAVAEPLFRWVLISILSFVINDTDSMTAFVLVTLFLRVTSEEISGAVIDVESNLVKEALSQGGGAGFTEAGRCVQLAIVMQILVGVPLLLIWVFFMDDVVKWFLPDHEVSDIAQIAGSYAKVIIIDYILRGITRAFMLPFHMGGQAQFERNIDVLASFFTIVAIWVVARETQEEGEPSLENIGWIQVIVGIAKAITKVAYVVLRGWLQPYQSGLIGSFSLAVSCQDVCILFRDLDPLSHTQSFIKTESRSSFFFLSASFTLVPWFAFRDWRGE
jgi:hypothetical protein